MKKSVRVILIVLGALCAIMLAVWLLPMPAGRWGEQAYSTGYTGAFARNGSLDEPAYLELGGNSHPETVLVRDGWVYFTARGGKLIRMREDGADLVEIMNTGGCLLGFDFDNDGNIVVADCDYKGTGALLRVADRENSQPEVLVSRELGFQLYYTNAIAVASDGTVYFTDSSSAFPPSKYGGSSSDAAANEALMHSCTGRVLAYDPLSGDTRILSEGGAFSNGLAFSADERSLYVCETYAYAVRRIDLDTGVVSDFLSNLPGFPDNLTKGENGRYWVGLNGERSDSLDAISNKPLLRKAVWLYGKLTAPSGTQNGGYCHVFAFTEDGAVVESLQSGSNGYYRSTGATETADRLYIQSINDVGKLAYIQRTDGAEAE